MKVAPPPLAKAPSLKKEASVPVLAKAPSLKKEASLPVLAKTASLKKEASRAQRGEKTLDLCLLLDCTGSMASWI